MFRSWFAKKPSSPPEDEPCAAGEPRRVDDRTFLLGLDSFIREAMRHAEKGPLLACAERVVSTLRLTVPAVPIEGYYAEEPVLARYFALMRAIQAANLHTYGSRAVGMPEFQRLHRVASSAIFGESIPTGTLLPRGRDPLAVALSENSPGQWSIPILLAAAKAAAERSGDISIVGLGCRIADPYVITALRESVVLYAECVLGAAVSPTYSWDVSPELASWAGRTIEVANQLFDGDIPAPLAQNAAKYYNAAQENRTDGRCVCLGEDVAPRRRYHWAISSTGEVCEFWDREMWTTERFRQAQQGRR